LTLGFNRKAVLDTRNKKKGGSRWLNHKYVQLKMLAVMLSLLLTLCLIPTAVFVKIL
jgi:hypothetical protein